MFLGYSWVFCLFLLIVFFYTISGNFIRHVDFIFFKNCLNFFQHMFKIRLFLSLFFPIFTNYNIFLLLFWLLHLLSKAPFITPSSIISLQIARAIGTIIINVKEKTFILLIFISASHDDISIHNLRLDRLRFLFVIVIF